MSFKCENMSGVFTPFLTPTARTLAIGNLTYTLVWHILHNMQNFHPYFLWNKGISEDLLFQISSLQRQWLHRRLLELSVFESSRYAATLAMQRHLTLIHGLSYRPELTLAGVWIQMAALNRMWSHSCFSSGAPCVRPSRYFAKERNCSNTALVMCAREDCRKKHKVM